MQTERRKPRDVYGRMAVCEESFVKPRDHKQVRNVAQSLPTANEKERKGNAADELQVLVGSIHNHPFVKELCVRHGRPAVVVGFTALQVADLRRFCIHTTPSYLRTVVGIDRTFNLGPCYVTITVLFNLFYKVHKIKVTIGDLFILMWGRVCVCGSRLFGNCVTLCALTSRMTLMSRLPFSCRMCVRPVPRCQTHRS